MKKTVVEYITDTLEDIPKQSLQTNKRRLHAFFSEQETIEKRGTHFVFRYAFYSVEKLRRPTKQSKHPIKYTLYFHKIENSISTLVKS